MEIIRTRAELAGFLDQTAPPALVATMGALHEGHLALVAAARATGPVIVSIFVNPLQFGAGEDLARYPRDEAGDLTALRMAGCAAAFLPAVAVMYPPGNATTIEVAGPAEGFEGERRPGHFRGVATIVARLIGLVRPHSAWFGQKDWQQLQVIRRMVADLCLPVAIRDLPTVRAPDGLALSSRNRFLDPAARAAAPELPRACRAAAAAIAAGAAVDDSLAAARLVLQRCGFDVDYLALVHPESLHTLATFAGTSRLIVAARLGGVRLLDNFAV